MTREEALRVIIAASPGAAGDALACIRSIRANSPMVNERFNRVVERAFNDPDAQFTTEQRASIAQLIDIPDEENRDYMFRIRLTGRERDALQALADAAGITMSEWARRRLFLPSMDWRDVSEHPTDKDGRYLTVIRYPMDGPIVDQRGELTWVESVWTGDFWLMRKNPPVLLWLQVPPIPDMPNEQ